MAVSWPVVVQPLEMEKDERRYILEFNAGIYCPQLKTFTIDHRQTYRTKQLTVLLIQTLTVAYG